MGSEAGHEGSAGQDRCHACGSLLSGPYCSSCGRRHSAGVPTLGDLAKSTARELLDLPATVGPTFHALLFRPGRLTLEYAAGRGSASIHPARLFVLCGALAFLSSRVFEGFLFLISLRPVAEGVGEEWAIWALLLIAVPATALMLSVLFANARWRFVTHVVFATHWFSFLLVLAASEPPLATLLGLTGNARIAGLALFAWASIYSVIALKTAYAQPWVRTVLKFLVLLLGYLAALGWLLSDGAGSA